MLHTLPCCGQPGCRNFVIRISSVHSMGPGARCYSPIAAPQSTTVSCNTKQYGMTCQAIINEEPLPTTNGPSIRSIKNYSHPRAQLHHWFTQPSVHFLSSFTKELLLYNTSWTNSFKLLLQLGALASSTACFCNHAGGLSGPELIII